MVSGCHIGPCNSKGSELGSKETGSRICPAPASVRTCLSSSVFSKVLPERFPETKGFIAKEHLKTTRLNNFQGS